MKRLLIAATAAAALLVSGCSPTDSAVVRENLDLEADQFKVNRRIVFINGITDKYLLEIQGRCSYSPEANQVVVLCKIAEGDGPSSFKKHSMVRSDNVTVVVEQLEGMAVSEYHHKILFKPESLIPTVDLETSLDEE